MFSQQNAEILAIAVPLHMAVAFVLHRWAAGRTGSASEA
jgi:hypothetical protein